ncbi:MAG: SSS family solute:Na+ symporter [Bacteroidia bacterium]
MAHYALRPWPWIVIALCSVVVFPNLDSIQEAFPHISPDLINDDLAYPAMLTFLPAGLLGLVIASLVAAFMSTISTHLNWGSSYVVNDFYQRFIKPDATEKELVMVGRLSTVFLMLFAALFALALTNALQAFGILLQIGAGTGAIFILRWFWWRINAWTEISGMVISFFVAIFFEVINPKMELIEIAGHWKLVAGVGITTIGWLIVTFLTQPESKETLERFCEHVNPTVGWKDYRSENSVAVGNLPLQIFGMFLGCVVVYSALFATGSFIYGNLLFGGVLATVSALSLGGLASLWKKF